MFVWNQIRRTMTTNVQLKESIDKAEQFMLGMAQAPCPVNHYFGPGIYIREVLLPAGIIAIGHRQKFDHVNVMIKGKVAMVTGENDVKVLEAPLIFNGKPGRKIGYVIEDCVWQNIYATDETDVEKLENHFMEKSDCFNEFKSEKDSLLKSANQLNIDDYNNLLKEYGFTESQVRAVSENQEDQIPFPPDWPCSTTVRESPIEGRGLFLNWPVGKDFVVAPARLMGKRTPAGRYVNHSAQPNCVYRMLDNGDIYLVSNREIRGCRGGDFGEELTVDYRQSLSLGGIK